MPDRLTSVVWTSYASEVRRPDYATYSSTGERVRLREGPISNLNLQDSETQTDADNHFLLAFHFKAVKEDPWKDGEKEIDKYAITWTFIHR